MATTLHPPATPQRTSVPSSSGVSPKAKFPKTQEDASKEEVPEGWNNISSGICDQLFGCSQPNEVPPGQPSQSSTIPDGSLSWQDELRSMQSRITEQVSATVTATITKIQGDNTRRFDAQEKSIKELQDTVHAHAEASRKQNARIKEVEAKLEKAISFKAEDFKLDESAFDRPVVGNILRVAAQNRSILLLSDLRAKLDELADAANLEHSSYKITDSKGLQGNDHSFVVHFKGEGNIGAKAAQRMLHARRSKTGEWKSFSAKIADSEAEGRFYINADANPKMLKTRREGLRMCKIIATQTGKKAFFHAPTSTVKVEWKGI